MKPIKRAIALCWIMLVACFIVKLFGGNWFEVVCTNEHFIMVCDFIDNNKFLWCVVGISTYITSSSLIIFSCLKSGNKLNKTNKALVFLCLAICWSSQFISSIFKCFIEILAIIALPIILNVWNSKEKLKEIKNVWYYGIICACVTFGFQAISFITRNIGIVIVDDSTLLSLILLIDYYIMSFLFYLHSKLLREGEKNG